MKPSDTNPPGPDQLEERITALFLGELSPDQAAALRQQIQADPELAAFAKRMEKTIGLVRQVAQTKPSEEAQTQTPATLSPERRQALLQQLRTEAEPEKSQPARVEPSPPSAPFQSIFVQLRQQWRWALPFALAASLVAFLGLQIFSLLNRSQSASEMASVDNLRSINGAKSDWKLEESAGRVEKRFYDERNGRFTDSQQGRERVRGERLARQDPPQVTEFDAVPAPEGRSVVRSGSAKPTSASGPGSTDDFYRPNQLAKGKPPASSTKTRMRSRVLIDNESSVNLFAHHGAGPSAPGSTGLEYSGVTLAGKGGGGFQEAPVTGFSWSTGGGIVGSQIRPITIQGGTAPQQPGRGGMQREGGGQTQAAQPDLEAAQVAENWMELSNRGFTVATNTWRGGNGNLSWGSFNGAQANQPQVALNLGDVPKTGLLFSDGKVTTTSGRSTVSTLGDDITGDVSGPASVAAGDYYTMNVPKEMGEAQVQSIGGAAAAAPMVTVRSGLVDDSGYRYLNSGEAARLVEKDVSEKASEGLAPLPITLPKAGFVGGPLNIKGVKNLETGSRISGRLPVGQELETPLSTKAGDVASRRGAGLKILDDSSLIAGHQQDKAKADPPKPPRASASARAPRTPPPVREAKPATETASTTFTVEETPLIDQEELLDRRKYGRAVGQTIRAEDADSEMVRKANEKAAKKEVEGKFVDSLSTLDPKATDELRLGAIRAGRPSDSPALTEQLVEEEGEPAEKYEKKLAEITAKLEPEPAIPEEPPPPPKPTRPLAPAKPAPAAPTRPPAQPLPETLTEINPFSTFSLNVSDVSYKLAAASLANRALPEPGSIRSEEFINAFDYHDPAPLRGAKLAFAWEQSHNPFEHNRDLIRFSIQTAALGREPGRSLNLVLLLDNSGSMERADRVRIVQQALAVLARQLTPADRVSVVAFARRARLWVDGLAGGDPEELVRQVGNLNPQGGTNLELALDLAYATAEKHFLPKGNNRVILLTDGAANLGNVDPAALKEKVESYRHKGIALDCFGVGWEGYNDTLLEVLSRNGDGRYGFINNPREAATEFADQLAGALRVAAANVKAQVQFNPQRVISYRQIGYEKHQLTKEQFRDNTVDAAEIGAAESGTALYSIQVNRQGSGPVGVARVRFASPATGQYEEHEWLLAYNPAVLPLDRAYASIRLAAVGAAFAEWLAGSPFAGNVTLAALQHYLGDVPETYSLDPRPKQLATMIQQARQISGK